LIGTQAVPAERVCGSLERRILFSANLWWKQNTVMYQIQIGLSPEVPEGEQQRILVEMANSTVAVP